MKQNFEKFNFPTLHRLSCKKSLQILGGDCERLPYKIIKTYIPHDIPIEYIKQKKQKTKFDQSFLNDSSYLYSYPIKIPKPENHTSERNQYSLNKLVQIYQNSDGKYIDINKKIIKNEDVYIVSSPNNDTNTMTVYFFKLDEIIHYRKNHEKSGDGISCRFSLGFTDGKEINLIDVLDKNCFYKNAYDRNIPYTSLYKILCIKTRKEYLMTSSLSGKENDAMLSVGLPYDHPFCIGIDKDVVLNGMDLSQTPESAKNIKRKHVEFNPFPETILPTVYSTSKFLDY
jgi:hypothetical protein